MLVRPESNSRPPAWQPGAQAIEPPVSHRWLLYNNDIWVQYTFLPCLSVTKARFNLMTTLQQWHVLCWEKSQSQSQSQKSKPKRGGLAGIAYISTHDMRERGLEAKVKEAKYLNNQSWQRCHLYLQLNLARLVFQEVLSDHASPRENAISNNTTKH